MKTGMLMLTVGVLVVILAHAQTNKMTPAAETKPTADTPATRTQKPANPSVFVEEVSSEGGRNASSDTALEAIKTLQNKHIRVVTIKEKADYILEITRQLGKKRWSKDTKFVLSNRDGEVVLAKSTRSVGGSMGEVADYIHKHSE